MNAPARPRASGPMRRLFLIGALMYTACVGCRLSTALAAVHAQLSPAIIGPLMAVFALMPLLFAVRGGKVIDRIGVRTPMMTGAVLVVLGTLIAGFFQNALAFILTAACIGLGNMAFHLGMQHCAGEMGQSDSERTANFNLLTMGFSLSGMVGPPLAGWVIDHAGHAIAFVVLGGLAACVWVACRLFDFERHLPHGGRRVVSDPSPPSETDEIARTSGNPFKAWRKAFELLGAQSFRLLLMSSLLFSAAWDAFQFVIPLHAHRIELNASSVGLAIASFSSGSLTVRLLMPWISRWTSPSKMVAIAMGVVILGYLVLPWSSHLHALMAISFVVGMGPGVAQPLLMSALHVASPHGRAGEASGLRMTLVSVVQIVSPVVLGMVAAALGITAIFYAFSLAAAAVALTLWKARQSLGKGSPT
jgi:MFS family permease